jgi:hypothetical protein
MKAIGKFAMLALMLGTVPGLAFATAPHPLRLDLPSLPQAANAPSAPRATAFERSMVPRDGRQARIAPLFRRDQADARPPVVRTDLQERARDLGRQALRNVLDQDATQLDDQRGEGQMQLKFSKRGNAFGDFNKSYRNMCDNVSKKLWDDPDGKRIRFDVNGKPGVAFEIPVGHHEHR